MKGREPCNKMECDREPGEGRSNLPQSELTMLGGSTSEVDAASVNGSSTAPETADELLQRANRNIHSAIECLRSAAEDIAAAQELGATQREIAVAVGMSLGWVNALLKWRLGNYQDRTPFGRQTKLSRQKFVQSLNKGNAQSKVGTSDREVDAGADAVPVVASAEPTSSHRDRACTAPRREETYFTDAHRERLIKTLHLLGSDQAGERENAALAAERLRHGLKLTWDELIIAARHSGDVEDLLAPVIT